MAIRTILHYPNPRLRLVAKPVTEINNTIQTLCDDMLETMYSDEGIGLAAIQIGEQHRVVVMDHSDDRTKPMFFINPEILEKSDTLVNSKEGCLSVPGGVYDTVKRAEKVRVKFQDRKGEWHEQWAEGLLSRCFQHEINHLDGILFIDHLSLLKRQMIDKKLKKLQKIRL